MGNEIERLFISMVLGISLSICGCKDDLKAQPKSKAESLAPTSLIQSVPGSAARIVFCPIKGSDGTPPSFWIAETETTWDAYEPFAQRLDLPPDRRASAEADPGPDAVTRPTPPYSPPDRGWGHKGFPALGITSHAAQQYCRWLSESTGHTYRLPTVAEWQLSSGPTPADPLTAAWCEDNADDRAHAVRGKQPNNAGLYDTLGNVAEWCTDGGKPVVCGGSFVTPTTQLSSSLVERQTSAWQQSQPNFPKSKWWLSDGPFIGFRVVREK